MAEKNMMRINKYMAACGVCSRRQVDKLLQEGRVMVNGQVAVTGREVAPTDQVMVNGKPIQLPNKPVVLAYYKPVGVVCTEKDKHARRDVIQELGYEKRVTYAGRLDKDSEGLLLMTDDGTLIDRMMRGANRHEKEYIVRVDRELNQDDIEILKKGVYIKELEQKTRPCEIEKLGKYTMKIVLTQGLNRQIRRMCETRNYKVLQLKRVRIMNVFLASLKPGEYRELDDEECKMLYNQCRLNYPS